MKNRIIFFVLLFIFSIRPVSLILQQESSMFSKGYNANYSFLKSLYYSSQYVQKKNPSIIPDQALESFAGGAFLRGLNPILITHDHPPLGRYITALSILIFDNSGTLIVPLMFLSAFGIFLVAKLTMQNSIASLIPVGIFVNEPLFMSKLTNAPLLEPILLPFLIFSIYFFIKGIKEKNYIIWFILTSLLLGCVISIQFFITGLGLLFAMCCYFIFDTKSRQKFFYFIFCLPLSLVVLIASYAKTIQEGSSIVHIFGIQKYILYYHKSKFVLPFSFWDLLIFNRWHTWWGSKAISSDSQWIIAWPIVTFLAILFAIFGIVKKNQLNNAEKIILLWIGTICVILSSGYTSTRYFLPLLPFLYIIAVSFSIKLIYFLKTRL